MTMKLKEMKLSRYPVMLAAVWIIFLIVSIVGYWQLYQPLQAERIEVQRQFSESSQQLEQARLAARQETKQQIQQRLEHSTQTIADFCVPSESVTNLVFQIGQIANDLHLIDFSSKNQKNAYTSTLGTAKRMSEGWLIVEFFASFEQFARFINQLERNCPAVFVEKVQFRRGTAESKGHDIKLELSFLTSAQSSAEPAAAALISADKILKN